MVYVFLADGFEEIEAIAPIDILRRASCDVVTVGVSGSVVTGAHGVAVKADTTEINLNPGLEMIVLPGGSGGAKRLEASAMVSRAIDYCAENELHIAAICAAPTILGKRGLLKDKTAVCYPGLEGMLKGAKISEDGVVTDGIFTTGKGPGYSVQFGLHLAELLRGDAVAMQLAAGMCVDD